MIGRQTRIQCCSPVIDTYFYGYEPIIGFVLSKIPVGRGCVSYKELDLGGCRVSATTARTASIYSRSMVPKHLP